MRSTCKWAKSLKSSRRRCPEPVADAFEAPPERQSADHDVVIDGISLSVHSALGALKAACEKLGLSKSGSKQRCFDRLRG